MIELYQIRQLATRNPSAILKFILFKNVNISCKKRKKGKDREKGRLLN